MLAVTTYGDSRELPSYVIYALSERDVPVRAEIDATEATQRGYDWAVVSGPSFEEAWILARDPVDGARVLREVASLLPELGLTAEALRIEPQEGADYLTGSTGRTTTLRAWLETDAPPDWDSPGMTDTPKLGTMRSQKGESNAGTDTALSAGVQERGRRALSLVGQIYPEGRQRAWSVELVSWKVDQAA